jgi:hypothetical protein
MIFDSRKPAEADFLPRRLLLVVDIIIVHPNEFKVK